MIAPSQLALFDLGRPQEDLLMLDPDQCEPWPDLNPRTYFDPVKAAELDVSIRDLGVLQNIVVLDRHAKGEPFDGPRYWIVAGESRWRSATRVGVRLPARARWFTEAQALHIALLENLQRNNLRPREEGRGFRRSIELGGDLTQEELGARYGLDQSYVSNRMRLLELPDSIGELVDRGIVGPTLARDHLFGWLKLEAAKSTALFAALANMINGRADANEPVASVYVAPLVAQLTQIIAPDAQLLTKIEDAPKPGSTGTSRAKQKAEQKAKPKKPTPKRTPGQRLTDKDRDEVRKLAKSGTCTIAIACEMWSLTEPELLAIARTGWADPIEETSEPSTPVADEPRDAVTTPEEPDSNPSSDGSIAPECEAVGASPAVGQAGGTARVADDEAPEKDVVEAPAAESGEDRAETDEEDRVGPGAIGELAPILVGYTVTFVLYRPLADGPVILTVSPKKTRGKATSITPIVMQGTPAELDARLPEALHTMVAQLTDEDS